MDMIVEHDAVRAVGNAVEGFDLVQSSAWSDLDVLAGRVSVDALELDTDSVVVSADRSFSATGYVYLALQYGGGDDEFTTSESFRADIQGKLDAAGKAEIELLTVDTSPFYE